MLKNQSMTSMKHYPVVRLSTVCTLLGLAVIIDLELEQLDVKTAFMHGNFEIEIFMTQLEGFIEENKKHLVCQLTKSLYSLKHAPICWYERFDSFIVSLGFHRCGADH